MHYASLVLPGYENIEHVISSMTSATPLNENSPNKTSYTTGIKINASVCPIIVLDRVPIIMIRVTCNMVGACYILSTPVPPGPVAVE